MRIVTYNIHKWRTIGDQPNFGLLADLLKGIDADVIGLNEVIHPVSTEAGVALACLADELGMDLPSPRRAEEATRSFLDGR